MILLKKQQFFLSLTEIVLKYLCCLLYVVYIKIVFAPVTNNHIRIFLSIYSILTITIQNSIKYPFYINKNNNFK